MKKAMIRIIALALVFSFCLSLGSVSFAANEQDAGEQYYAEQLKDGVLICRYANGQSTVIITNVQKDIAEVAICKDNEPDVVYQYVIEDLQEKHFGSSLAALENDLISYCMDGHVPAKKISCNMQVIDYETPVVTRGGSAGADLKAQLRAIYGNEYSNSLLYNSTYNGKSMQIYEDMEYRIEAIKTYTWNNNPGLTVAGLISSYIGLAASTSLVGTICNILSLAISAVSIVPSSGKINQYRCSAMFDRNVRVNNSAYMYNITYKFIDFYGYENADPNSAERAQLDHTTTLSYSHNASYYGSFNSQLSDAYAMFQQVGQKP